MKKKIKISRFIMIVVLIYFICTLFSQQKTVNDYEKAAAEYQVQIEEAKEQTEELKRIKSNINSPEYIEEVAREKLGMYLPNERVYIDITN